MLRHTEIPEQEKPTEAVKPNTHDEQDIELAHFSARGTKLPVRVTFHQGAKRTSLPWRLSDEVTYDGNTITLVFTSATVTVKGRDLDHLFDCIEREKVNRIREAGQIDSIDIEPRKDGE